MGDHLTLLVDGLLTESTLQAATAGRKQAQQMAAASASLEDSGKESTRKRNVKDRASSGKLVDCRICHEEDEDRNMEIPCSCCGSLKYAHRKCVQKWCNEKGDTVCEICLQEYKPGYTAPPKLFHYGSLPMTFRGNWEISRDDLNDSEIITLFPTEHDPAAFSARSTVCCRSIAVVFTVLLLLRHSLPLLLSGSEQYSFAPFSLFVLKTAGILLPVFVMIRAVKAYHQNRHQQRSHLRLPRLAEGLNRVNSWQLQAS